MQKLRSVLGDSGAEPRFVETVPGRGYRFVAYVEESAHEVREAAEPDALARPSRRGKALLVAVSSIVVLGAMLFSRAGRPGFESPHPLDSVAVLPLENFSADAEEQYLADGLAAIIISRTVS